MQAKSNKKNNKNDNNDKKSVQKSDQKPVKKKSQVQDKPTQPKEKGLTRSASTPAKYVPLDESTDLSKQSLSLANFPVIIWAYIQSIPETITSPVKGVGSLLQKLNPLNIAVKFKTSLNKLAENYSLISRLMSYLGDQKLIVVFAYISLISTSVCQTKMPQIIGNMIDTVVVGQSTDLLRRQAVNFFFICVTFSISEFFWGYLFNLLSQKIRWIMKKQVYGTLVRREVEFFDKKPLSEVLNFVHDLIYNVESICTNQFSSIGRNVIQLLYSGWMLASISYKLTIFLLFIVPVHLIIPMAYNKIRAKIVGQEMDHVQASDNKVLETFQNIRIIKAFSTEDREVESFEGFLNRSAGTALRSSLAWSGHMAFTGFFTNITLLGIVYVGMVLVSHGDVTPGTLSSFLLFSMSISAAFRDASLNFINLKNSLPNARKLFDLLAEPAKIPYKGGKTIKNFEGKVELRNVTFAYPVAPEVPILKDVSLTIKPGDSVAFVGMSGGGKSTIISLLLRFYDVTNGQLKIDGVDLKDLDLQWLHSQIGYVAQDPVLFSGTVEENITYGLEKYTQEALAKILKMANAEFVYNKDLFPEGLKSQVGERGGRLSGGQKQRLAIARALMREPRILIFDEATSALDANAEFEVQKAIDNLLSSNKVTVITIAHRLSTIMKCNVIFVLKSGEVVEQGSHKQLLEKDSVYRVLVEKQFQKAH